MRRMCWKNLFFWTWKITKQNMLYYSTICDQSIQNISIYKVNSRKPQHFYFMSGITIYLYGIKFKIKSCIAIQTLWTCNMDMLSKLYRLRQWLMQIVNIFDINVVLGKGDLPHFHKKWNLSFLDNICIKNIAVKSPEVTDKSIYVFFCTITILYRKYILYTDCKLVSILHNIQILEYVYWQYRQGEMGKSLARTVN